MSIKRYAAHTNIDDFKSDWHESKDGPMVKYSDYSALEQQLTALTSQLESVVAENAALKSSILNTQGAIELACAAVNDDRRGDVFRDILNAIYVKTASETPATDAFLAEVRASGVEMFAMKLAHYVHRSEYSQYFEDEALKFAAQLRQEAAK